VWLLGAVTSANSHPDLSRANKSRQVDVLFSFPAFKRKIANQCTISSTNEYDVYKAKEFSAQDSVDSKLLTAQFCLIEFANEQCMGIIITEPGATIARASAFLSSRSEIMGFTSSSKFCK
jgi:hypothetical protein